MSFHSPHHPHDRQLPVRFLLHFSSFFFGERPYTCPWCQRAWWSEELRDSHREKKRQRASQYANSTARKMRKSRVLVRSHFQHKTCIDFLLLMFWMGKWVFMFFFFPSQEGREEGSRSEKKSSLTHSKLCWGMHRGKARERRECWQRAAQTRGEMLDEAPPPCDSKLERLRRHENVRRHFPGEFFSSTECPRFGSVRRNLTWMIKCPHPREKSEIARRHVPVESRRKKFLVFIGSLWATRITHENCKTLQSIHVSSPHPWSAVLIENVRSVMLLKERQWDVTCNDMTYEHCSDDSVVEKSTWNSSFYSSATLCSWLTKNSKITSCETYKRQKREKEDWENEKSITQNVQMNEKSGWEKDGKFSFFIHT